MVYSSLSIVVLELLLAKSWRFKDQRFLLIMQVHCGEPSLLSGSSDLLKVFVLEKVGSKSSFSSKGEFGSY